MLTVLERKQIKYKMQTEKVYSWLSTQIIDTSSHRNEAVTTFK